MGRVHDGLEAAFTETIDDPQLFLDCDCMMEIFANVESDIPTLKEYLTSMFENESNPTISKIGTNKDQCNQAKVLGLDSLCDELFFPQSTMPRKQRCQGFSIRNGFSHLSELVG